MDLKDFRYVLKNLSIKELADLIDQNKLKYDKTCKYHYPKEEDFHDQLSLFIESLLINFPMEPIWLLMSSDERYSIVKGHKMLIFLDQFLVEGKGFVKLKNLGYLSHLNGENYTSLNRKYQRKIEERIIPCYIVMPEVPADIVWDVYQRLK